MTLNWVYEEYWNAVLGGCNPIDAIRKFGLVREGLNEWLRLSESAAWTSTGRPEADIPRAWEVFHVRAMGELTAALPSNDGLHVFRFDRKGPEFDWIIARDIDDAWTIWCEHHGKTRADYEATTAVTLLQDWRQVLVDGEYGSAAEWAFSHGREYLTGTVECEPEANYREDFHSDG